jgi:hypothetical protein
MDSFIWFGEEPPNLCCFFISQIWSRFDASDDSYALTSPPANLLDLSSALSRSLLSRSLSPETGGALTGAAPNKYSLLIFSISS